MSGAVALSHVVAAIAYATLAGFLLTRWRSRMRGSMLMLAVLVTIAWALVMVAAPDQGNLMTLAAEFALALAWMAFLRQALAGTSGRRLARTMSIGPVAVATVGIVLGVVTTVGGPALAGGLTFGRVRDVACLLLAIFGVVYAEQVVRNTGENSLWAAKFLWLGAGGIFVYNIALFSANFAFGELQPALTAARGVAFALLTPVIAIGVTRIREFQPQVLMSRQLLYYTTSAILVGGYLVAVAIVGYYVRALGGRLGDAALVLLVFSALVALVAMASSEALRARLRVWLAKHWFPYKYDYRTEWLDLTGRLVDADGSSLPQRTIDAFQRLGRATGGSIFLVHDDFLEFSAGELFEGHRPIAEPVSGPFCQFLQQQEWIVDLDRARAGQGRDAAVPLPDWLSASTDAWLAIPLLHDRRLLAVVVLRRPLIDERLTWEDLDLLRTAARQAASYLALANSGEALARERQFAALNRFSAFVMHDLSNILAQQRLIVDNAGRHKSNPAFIDDAFTTIGNTVHRMTRLLDQLKAGTTDAARRRVRVADVCREAVRRLSDRAPRPTLTIAEDVEIVIATERFETVLEHVIRNAQDATPADGAVTVHVARDGENAVITVTDTGRGMEPEFIRTRLFQPFHTTKGTKGMGIGAFQAREFVRAAGGDVDVRSSPGAGTAFVIRFPRAA